MRPVLTGKRCMCAACGELFNNAGVFDKHRVGPYAGARRCLSRTELVSLGWKHSAAGFWVGRERQRPAGFWSGLRSASEEHGVRLSVVTQ